MNKSYIGVRYSLSLRFLLLFLILAPACSIAGDQTPPAQQLIRQMSEANHALNYEGVFIYRRQGKMDTMRIIHKVDENGVQERIVSLTGFAREVIRDKNSVTCILPDDESVMVERSSPRQFKISQLPEQISKVSEYYTFSIAGQDRVANRPAWVVDILPKDDYRFGYQLWIDLESKLLLKSELKNKDGTPLEQFFFAKLQIIEEIPDEWLKPEISGVGYTWHDNSSEDFPVHKGDVSWKVTWMPDGFVMSDREKKSVDESQMPVEHLMYSDGLALVSVFVEKIDKPVNIVTGPSSMGGVNTFSTMIDNYLITAIGEVPRDTVKLFAKSVVSNK
jgi:sigma-E factor negative regulatory protein RseB